MMKRDDTSTLDTPAVATVLGQRFGDGSVFVYADQDGSAVGEAQRLGFVDEEGFITPAGHAVSESLEPSSVP